MSERAMPTRGPVKVMIEAGDEWWFGHGDEITLRPASRIGCALAVMHADEQSIANFDLFAAAINASREAADLGFDPIAAVEALPAMLRLVLDIGAMHPDDIRARIGAQADAILSATQLHGEVKP